MNIAQAREQTLRARVEQVYAVFRRYRLPAEIDPDPCFPSFCDDRPLRAAPLRELPESAFKQYPWKAITTWGMVDDFKHFLPRLLDLIATPLAAGCQCDLDPYIVFAKIEYGNWHRWLRDEREAIAEYVSSLWRALLTRPYLGYIGVDRWLQDFSEIYDDLSPFLSAWEDDLQNEETAPWPGLHLAEMIIDSQGTMSKKGSLDWWRKDAQGRQVVRWLRCDVISTILETAFFRAPDDTYAERLSLAVEMHKWWQSLAVD